jgi:DNA polymerase III subunit epsilon
VSWFDRWLPVRSHAPAHIVDAVRAWQCLPAPDRRVPLASACFVVVDTETTGLDPYSAGLLSIGACKVESSALLIAPSFDVDLRRETPSGDENILIHGIGRQRQMDGATAADALCEFLRFAGRPVFVGFHALFDATVLKRALRAELGITFDMDWLDLAVLLPAVFPDVASGPWELDRWLAHLGVSSFGRHNALADAIVTAELLLLVLQRARKRGAKDVRSLHDLQRIELKRQVTARAVAPAG